MARGRGIATTGAARMLAEQKQQQVFKLRLAGVEFDAIAREVGYRTASGAYMALKAYLAKIHKRDAEQHKMLNISRLNRLLLAVWTTATDGGYEAQERALAILKELNKMLGLYEPQAHNITLDVVRHEAERIAAEYGLTPEEVTAEAERIVAEAQRG